MAVLAGNRAVKILLAERIFHLSELTELMVDNKDQLTGDNEIT